MEGTDLHASVQPQKRNARNVVPRTSCEKCVGELKPHSAAPARHDHQHQGGGKRATIQLFEPHLNTALPHAQRERVPLSRHLTAGRVGYLRMYVVCCMLYVVCCMLYVVCCMLYVVCCMLYVVCCMLYVVC